MNIDQTKNETKSDAHTHEINPQYNTIKSLFDLDPVLQFFIRSNLSKIGLNEKEMELCEDLIRMIYSYRGNDTSVKGAHGNRLLHLAVFFGNKYLVYSLLKNHADPNVKNSSGYTPFHLASMSPQKDVIYMFKNINININATDDDKFYNYTALHWAIFYKNLDTINFLLESGADINISCKNKTAIAFAVKSQKLDIIFSILNRVYNQRHGEAFDASLAEIANLRNILLSERLYQPLFNWFMQMNPQGSNLEIILAILRALFGNDLVVAHIKNTDTFKETFLKSVCTSKYEKIKIEDYRKCIVKLFFSYKPDSK